MIDYQPPNVPQIVLEYKNVQKHNYVYFYKTWENYDVYFVMSKYHPGGNYISYGPTYFILYDGKSPRLADFKEMVKICDGKRIQIYSKNFDKNLYKK